MENGTVGSSLAATLGVEEALGLFMARGQDWACRTVARAHPAQAFEPSGMQIPALWLSEKSRFPKYYKELLEALPSDAGRLAAVENCSRLLARRTLDSIVPALCFQSALPAASQSRRLRGEAKLAKSIAKIIGAASSKGGPGLEELRGAAKAGVALGVEDFKLGFPAQAAVANGLGWEALADQALARAERKVLGKASKDSRGEEIQACAEPRRPMRL